MAKKAIEETLELYKGLKGERNYERECAGYHLGKDMRDFWEGGISALEEALIRLDDVVVPREKPLELEVVELNHYPSKADARENAQYKLEVAILDLRASGMNYAEIEIELHSYVKKFIKYLKED